MSHLRSIGWTEACTSPSWPWGGDEGPRKVASISTVAMALDLALGVGEAPRGPIVEIYRERNPSGGFRYVLLETARVSGNQFFGFSSKDKGLVYAALVRELDASLR